MRRKNYKVSIIIPVYNIEKYIERCIESIINQSYSNIEIIVVNDGSTDKSTNICENFKVKDSRIKIINKINGGLSSARNTGLDAATGEFIMFVDGDDWIDTYCIESCLEVVENNTDVVLFPYIREYHDKSLKNDIFQEDKIIFIDDDVREKILKRLFGIEGEDIRRPDRLEDISTAWGKLYKLELIKNIRFVDTKIIGTEDVWFNVNSFLNAKNIIFTKKTYYHYFKENDTSLTQKYNPYLFERWQNLYRYMEKFIEENKLGKEFVTLLDNRKIINLLALNRNIINSNLKFTEKIYEINIILKNNLYEKTFKNFPFSDMSLKWKAFYKSCYYKNAYLVYFIAKCAERLKKVLK